MTGPVRCPARVVVAPDKFKGCLSAPGVAHAITLGLQAAAPGLEAIELPVADGGDGTVDAALAAGFRRLSVTAEGPTGEPVDAAIAVRGDSAVIELADVAGLRRMGDTLAPLRASTFGLGQLVKAALDHGATTVILGLGGSAATDGGAGMMQALGLRLLDQAGQPIGRGGGALPSLASADTSGLDPRLRGTRVLVAGDVDNPLLGPDGTANMFARQKGADDRQVALLERGMSRWARISGQVTGKDVTTIAGAGAAGGTGFAALAYLNASVRPGIELVLEFAGFEAAVAAADLVVTGEGSIDEQTLRGKAPLGVARAAARRGIPVVAAAGRSVLAPDALAKAGFTAVYPLTSLEADPAVCLRDAVRLLERTGRMIARDFAGYASRISEVPAGKPGSLARARRG